MKRISKKRVFFAILLALFLFFWGYKLFFATTEVKAYKIEQQNAVKGVTVTGTVESSQDIMLSPSVTGTVKQIYFKEGDYVKKGQLLAVLDTQEQSGILMRSAGTLESAYAQYKNLLTEPRQQQLGIAFAQTKELKDNISSGLQDVQQAQIKLNDAQSDETRFQKLYQDGAVSYRDYEKTMFARQGAEKLYNASQSQLEALKQKLAQSEQNLSLTKAGTKKEQLMIARGQILSAKGDYLSSKGRLNNFILRAPESGYITQKLSDVGEAVSSTKPILRLVVSKDIYVSALVEENELANISEEQKAYVVFDAYPDKTVEGTVFKVIKNVDPVNGSFIAKIRVQNNAKTPVFVGMTCDITLVTGEMANSIVIPSDFVIEKEKVKNVFKKDGSFAKKIIVDAKTFDNNRLQILKGLSNGDVIVEPYENAKLSNGTRIKIKEYFRD